jgi:acyl-CoA synthetase (AMP-forming)/AMP-acid ligase II
VTELLIGDVFRRAARAAPNTVAAVVGEETVTFATIERESNAMARALREFGVAPGDRVVVWTATTLALVPLFAALAKCGGVFAPMGPQLHADEAAAMGAVARPSLLVVDDERAAAGGDVAARLAVPVVTLAELAARAATQDDGDFVAVSLRETDPHVVFFTSGSTGQSKAAVLSHRVNFLRTHPGGLAERRGTLVCMFPLFHMAGWTMGLQQWQAREPIVFVNSADAATLCRAVAQHHATRLYCIPAVWRRVLDHLAALPAAERPNLSSLRHADTGTSATPPELLTALRAALPAAEVRVFYGSTEAGGVCTLEHRDIDAKPGSCGQPAPLAEVRIGDDGELLARGLLVFDGYLDDPEANRAAFCDGWFRTGDLADVDDDGFFTIVGRKRDVIRTGGESVAPVEVELALAAHSAIADVAVVGLPDAQWGEVVCAVVVTRDDVSPPTLDDLRAHCASRLAPPKHPRRLVIVDAIPRTASTNQIQRRLLVERLS